MTTITLDKDYTNLLNQLKEKIRSAQLRAAIAVNTEVIQLYWYIGKQIIEKQQQSEWGSKFIEALSHDLQNSFPETYGFSKRNLERMRQFAQAYPTLEFTAQAVPQLPWGHIVVLLQKVKEMQEREWYACKAIEEGWSRTILELYLKRNLYQQQALKDNKASNFLMRLASPQSELAQEILKNSYNFDFLDLHDAAREREIEHASIEHVTKFLLELGKGFAFVGRQVPLTLENEAANEKYLMAVLNSPPKLPLPHHPPKLMPAQQEGFSAYRNAYAPTSTNNDTPTNVQACSYNGQTYMAGDIVETP